MEKLRQTEITKRKLQARQRLNKTVAPKHTKAGLRPTAQQTAPGKLNWNEITSKDALAGTNALRLTKQMTSTSLAAQDGERGPESRYSKELFYKPYETANPPRHIASHDGEVRLFGLPPEMSEPDLNALVYDLNVEEYTNDHKKAFDKPLQDLEALLRKDPQDYKPKDRAKKGATLSLDKRPTFASYADFRSLQA